MKTRKVCVVTGTRAEYGLLSILMHEIAQEPDFVLQIIATGMHLSPEFGLTYKAIEEDGFHIDEKVEMLLSSDTAVGTAKSVGLGVIGFADAFARLMPDLIVVLGDRFEILAAVQAALVARIPVAHIGGGDTTEGAFDEAIRHSITKMAHLHFVTNPLSAQRVRQLGENPEYIFVVGNPGLDHLRTIQLLSRAELSETLEFPFRAKNILVTFHPVTLDEQPPEEQFRELLNALNRFPELGVVFTKPNADTNGRILCKMLDEYTEEHANTKAFTSLGQLRYLSMIAQVDAVVGNSSSGLYEVPSFQKPTVDIGDRQKGRLAAASVIHCQPQADEIAAAIQVAFNRDCSQVFNPYGDGNSSKRIVSILREVIDWKGLVKKQFYFLERD